MQRQDAELSSDNSDDLDLTIMQSINVRSYKYQKTFTTARSPQESCFTIFELNLSIANLLHDCLLPNNNFSRLPNCSSADINSSVKYVDSYPSSYG